MRRGTADDRFHLRLKVRGLSEGFEDEQWIAAIAGRADPAHFLALRRIDARRAKDGDPRDHAPDRAAVDQSEHGGARPCKEDRRTIETIIWRLDNGAKWRSIPAELGNWHHAYLCFRRWAVIGVWDKIMAHVVAEGELKLAFACIDGTIARAH